MSRPILITSALPYANGSIHIGQLVEYIQTDILVRFLRQSGQAVLYFCADDTHGTPIEVNARKRGITPEQLIAGFYEEHQRDFADFDVAFDEFYTTHSPENEKHCVYIFEQLRARGQIVTRPVEQYYCERDQRFLPDRFIRGTCPSCGAEDQYGDVCEACSSTYQPTDLADPRCAICGTPPVRRESKHYFFTVGDYESFLREWMSAEGRLHPEVRRFLETWLERGLRDWDISRDGPYFGFKIPGEEDKYFYVWLDAPVGYVATTDRYCQRTDRDLDALWRDPEARIWHVIGKDIVYFHTLFWPATLRGSGYSLPERVVVHGFLTVNGKKMSTSRGTFISARTYLDHLDPQYLRYYYATKLGPKPDDLDLNLEDFAIRVNADLVNKIANLVSRAVPFVHKRFGGRLSRISPRDAAVVEEIRPRVDAIRGLYGELEFARVVQEIVAIADIANKHFQDHAPWDLVRTDPGRAREVCTLAVNCCFTVATLIKPILPAYAGAVERILRAKPAGFEEVKEFSLADCEIGPFERLVERVDPDRVQAMVEASRPG